jgi:hypothetical protein
MGEVKHFEDFPFLDGKVAALVVVVHEFFEVGGELEEEGVGLAVEFGEFLLVSFHNN